jgi:hypothetical protein
LSPDRDGAWKSNATICASWAARSFDLLERLTRLCTWAAFAVRGEAVDEALFFREHRLLPRSGLAIVSRIARSRS